MKCAVCQSVYFLLFAVGANAQEEPRGGSPAGEEGAFEYRVGEVNWLTGEGVKLGNIVFPELFVTGAWGMLEPGAGAGDFATAEHDPQVNGTLQAIELHLLLNVNEVLTGAVYGFGQLNEDRQWEAEFEEGFLHYRVNDWLMIGGGQFLNTVGFQAKKHLHAWDFVNQNLVNSRILNEGELITQGGEILVGGMGRGMLTLGGGGVRTHAHGHEEHEEEEDEDEHHLEVDEAGFNNWVFSLDYKTRLPFDKSALMSASFLAGENGFGRNTYAYGVGLQKVWKGHDHGQGGPEFCTGAYVLRTEFLKREVEASMVHEDEDEVDLLGFSDYGLSTALYYGLTDQVTLSVRHDWVSEVEVAELAEVHRISPAITTYLGPGQRVRARLQYDWTQSDALESEHVGWFQLQWSWGAEGGSPHGHSH